MRFIRRHKATTLGLAAVLCLACALPGAAAVTTDDEATAPSWGIQLAERLLDSIAGWFAFDGKGNDLTGDDDAPNFEGGLDDPTSASTECTPNDPACEGGPDWDPNG